jgi:hypothetical protein
MVDHAKPNTDRPMQGTSRCPFCNGALTLVPVAISDNSTSFDVRCQATHSPKQRSQMFAELGRGR